MDLSVSVLDPRLAICRLPSAAALPTWASRGSFYAICRTPEELSVVCSMQEVPAGVRHQAGWRAIQVAGPLDFNLVGILARLAGILAGAGVSLFAISTYDTDYILVPGERLQTALTALRAAGIQIT